MSRFRSVLRSPLLLKYALLGDAVASGAMGLLLVVAAFAEMQMFWLRTARTAAA